MSRSRLGALSAVPLAVSACTGATPHNNVLLFGTDTKLAIVADAPPTQGGIPEISIGYQRREAVWMPLVMNKTVTAESVLGGIVYANGTSEPDGGNLYKGVETRTPSSGPDKQIERTDAYSVFASFGSKFGASGDTTKQTADAHGALAQFFATGIAAQNLAQRDNVVAALKVDSSSEKAEQALKDEATAAKANEKKAFDALVQGYSPLIATEQANLEKLALCAKLDAGGNMKAIADEAKKLNPEDKFGRIPKLPSISTREALKSWWNSGDQSVHDAALAGAKTLCPDIMQGGSQ